MKKKKVAKKATAKKIVETETAVEIPKPDLRTARITLEGVTPLLVNNFDEKTRKQIEDDYQQKAKVKKKPPTPQEQYESSLYYFGGSKKRYGIPAAGLKKCAVSAVRYVDGKLTMTKCLGAFHVVGDTGGLIEIKGKPTIDERLVRVGNFGNKKPATRYRARFDEWSVTFDIMYNAGVISVSQLLNLYETAGFSVGQCEYRPEKSGNLGMFKVARK